MKNLTTILLSLIIFSQTALTMNNKSVDSHKCLQETRKHKPKACKGIIWIDESDNESDFESDFECEFAILKLDDSKALLKADHEAKMRINLYEIIGIYSDNMREFVYTHGGLQNRLNRSEYTRLSAIRDNLIKKYDLEGSLKPAQKKFSLDSVKFLKNEKN